MNDKTLIEQVTRLDANHLRIVKEQIRSLQAEIVYKGTIPKHEHDFDSCPHCKKRHVLKCGHNKNTKKLMYRCKDCGKQFTHIIARYKKTAFHMDIGD